MESESTVERKAPKRRSRKIWYGLLGGIGCAIFFGDYCAYLQPLGDAYIGLLQMTVLPFIVVSLTTNLGRLNPTTARRVAKAALAVIGGLWFVGLIGVVVLPLMFPEVSSASFFSVAMVEHQSSFDLVSLFVPSNPFRSLADSLVPGIVLFSVCLGVALMNMSDRQKLIEPLDVLGAALLKINGYIVKLTPLGVFTLVASSLGTMTLGEIERLQAYLVAYLVGVGLFTFWVLPMLVSIFSPFTYREVLRLSREALLTAFATGKTITVLPLLIDQTDKFLKQHGYPASEDQPTARTLYPLVYSFPNLGNLLTLTFIPFVAWYVGQDLNLGDYTYFLSTGLVTYFGKPVVAIPFLLDLMRLPADTFQLFLVSGVYVSRFGDLLSVMTLVSFTLLVAAWLHDSFKLQVKRVPVMLTSTIVLTGMSVLIPHIYLKAVLAESYNLDEKLDEMQALMNDQGAVVKNEVPPPIPGFEDKSVTERINVTGMLRVGYVPDNLPYSYFNRRQQLVGLDIDMALLLAEELECLVKFIPVEHKTLDENLKRGEVDVVMAGVPITTERMTHVRFSASYLDVAWALLVRDHDRHDFSSLAVIAAQDNLVLAVPENDYFRRKLEHRFPNANFTSVDSIRQFLEGKTDANAILVDAEGGAAWTLLYPSYHVVVPDGARAVQPLGFAVARDQGEFASFLSRWIDLKKKSGEFEDLYSHWILGTDPNHVKHRWSIIRDVLHWVE